RDSLLYREVYGLKGIPNILRGTIRQRGFCDAWSALVRIGLTDASYPILDSDKLTYHGLIEAYMDNGKLGSVKERTARMLDVHPESEVMEKLEWLGLFSKKRIPIANASPALILEDLLLEKWKLRKDDKDMIVMQHEFEYELDRELRLLKSTLIMKGENSQDTAMAKLVGLPLGITSKLVMEGKITHRGVSIPVMSEVYEPVLAELEGFGVVFEETETVLKKRRSNK
ncbi:MAG: saccharopine dehydrogenase, partial [Saprospiraceae bacterium]|nr:saccharopine dehydrogenase [Saprospiraceae bacterium]